MDSAWADWKKWLISERVLKVNLRILWIFGTDLYPFWPQDSDIFECEVFQEAIHLNFLDVWEQQPDSQSWLKVEALIVQPFQGSIQKEANACGRRVSFTLIAFLRNMRYNVTDTHSWGSNRENKLKWTIITWLRTSHAKAITHIIAFWWQHDLLDSQHLYLYPTSYIVKNESLFDWF